MCLDHLGAVIDRALRLVLQTADTVHLVAVRFHVPPVFCAVPARLRAIGFLASARGLIELGSALAAVRRGGGHVRPFCVCFSLCLWGVHGGRGEGVPPVTLPGYQGCCGAGSAALWRVVAPVSASLVAASAYRAPVVERVRSAERPGGDVVGFGAVGLQAGPPCERHATCGAGGLSGGAVAFEDGCAPALVSGGSGAACGHCGWGVVVGGGVVCGSPPPPGWLEGGVIWPGGVGGLALVGGGVVVGGRTVRGCGAWFLGDLGEP